MDIAEERRALMDIDGAHKRRDDIALQIFCAYLRKGSTIDLYPSLAENQIRVAFAMADVFVKIADEEPTHV
jgi:hypothetical protein